MENSSREKTANPLDYKAVRLIFPPSGHDSCLSHPLLNRFIVFWLLSCCALLLKVERCTAVSNPLSVQRVYLHWVNLWWLPKDQTSLPSSLSVCDELFFLLRSRGHPQRTQKKKKTVFCFVNSLSFLRRACLLYLGDADLQIKPSSPSVVPDATGETSAGGFVLIIWPFLCSFLQQGAVRRQGWPLGWCP